MLRIPMLLALAQALSLAGLLAPNTSAQERIDPRCFFVHDYRNVVAADFVMMRKLGVWDDIEAGALKVAISMAEKQLGFSFNALDRFTMTMSFPPDKRSDEPAQDQQRAVRMSVFDGGEELPLGAEMVSSMASKEYGNHTLYVQEWDEQSGLVRPNKNMQVLGNLSVIKQALDGTRKQGLPCSDVMSLAAGKGKRLGYMIADLSVRPARRTFLEDLFEGTEWPAGDQPTFVAGRVSATGDEDDLRLVLEATLRHAKVGEGLKVSEAAIDALLQRGREMPELRLFRKILKNAEKRTSGADVTVRVDLGRSRNAVGNLSMILAPLFLLSTGSVDEMPVQERKGLELKAQEAEVAEPPPPPKPKPKPEPEPKPEPKPAGGGGGGLRQEA